MSLLCLCFVFALLALPFSFSTAALRKVTFSGLLDALILRKGHALIKLAVSSAASPRFVYRSSALPRGAAQLAECLDRERRAGGGGCLGHPTAARYNAHSCALHSLCIYSNLINTDAQVQGVGFLRQPLEKVLGRGRDLQQLRGRQHKLGATQHTGQLEALLLDGAAHVRL